jgi:5-methylthioadenosine/S-adenosylhomocysteine deaminase
VSGKYLLKGGCVLTLGARTANLTEGDVLIEDGRISEIGTGLRARGAEHIDASHRIVMPGFVDAHRHSWKTLFRHLNGPADQRSLLDSELTAEDVYAASLLGLKGALAAGISTVVDWVDPPRVSATWEAARDAQRDSGARVISVLSSSISEQAIRAALNSGQGLVTTAFGAETADPESAAGEWAMAREVGLRIHHHVDLEDETRGRVEQLGQRGLLGDDVTLCHCSGVGDSDLAAISSAGAAVVLTPASEMTGGMGSPPIQRLIDNGIRPGLGVDLESDAPGDMFAQMRAVNSIQHAAMFDLKLSGKGKLPQLLTTRDVIKYATSDGAAAVGMSSEVGSLEPGKQADVLVLRTDLPNVHPVNDPIGAVVWGMDTSNVDWLFVGGKPQMREGDLAEGLERSLALALASHRRLVETSAEAKQQ